MTHSEIIYQQTLPLDLIYQFRESRDLMIYIITRTVFDRAVQRDMVFKLYQLNTDQLCQTGLVEIKCWARKPADVTWFRLIFDPNVL